MTSKCWTWIKRICW